MSDLTKLQDLWLDHHARYPEQYTNTNNEDLMLVGKRFGPFIVIASTTTHFPNPEIKHKALVYNPATMITYEGFINHLDQLEVIRCSDDEIPDRIKTLESILAG